MTYEELLINNELNGYNNVLPAVGKPCLVNSYWYSHWFVICDDGKCYLFDENGKEDDIKKVTEIYEDMIPKGIKTIVIPNSVTRIGYSAFCCSDITSVTIPNNVTSIGDYAFYGCNKLTSMEIPASMTIIGSWVFCNCINLKALIFKDKTFNQIKSMKNYPFGIKDKSIIRCN